MAAVSLEAPAPRKRKHQPSIPKPLRRDITQDACDLTRKYGKLFNADHTLKRRVVRLYSALLPPRPRRRGKPSDPETTRAIMLYARFHRKYSEERPREVWDRVCRALYPQYAGLRELERKDMRDKLRARVKSRSRSRRVRKSR